MVFSNKKAKMFLLPAVSAAGLLAAAIVGGLMSGSTAAAQENSLLPPGEDYKGIPKSTISTTGTASQNVKPDKVSVTVGVETNGTNASEAASRNADAMEQVISALTGLGIPENALATSSYSIYPVYEYRQPTQPCIESYPPPPECMPKQTIVGYGASNSITVTLDVNSTGVGVGEAIDTAVGAGANNVNAAYFFISDDMQQEIRNSLIRDAIDNARQRAELAADAIGYTVSGVRSINLNEVYFPVYYGRASAESDFAGAQTPLLPGEQQVSTSVNIIYNITDIAAAQ
ncbi:MAG TPA: SIMPL domain-containing protein [Nitrososphaera sp.]|nr:SIMPL domain-containing protein [Nitrososphaera sp.]